MAQYYLQHYGYVSSEPYLAHHGIRGQKWGVKHGPPYPLKDSNSYSRRISQKNKETINSIYKSLPRRQQELVYPGSTKDDVFFKSNEYNHGGTAHSIVMYNKNKKPIGFLVVGKIPANKSVSGKDDEGEIGLAVSSEAQGQGNATKMANETTKWFDNQDKIQSLWWNPDASNQGSIKTALKAGYYKDELGDAYIMTKQSRTSQQAANKISSVVRKDSKKPVGNQNCMLCVWAAEQWFRGKKVLPRPVYSPRDPIFKLNPKMIVKNKTIKSIGELNDVVNYCKNMPYGSRFYCHVNWKGSSGGHEFLVLNDLGNIRVLDAQDGTYDSINSPNSQSYFNSINSDNSYIFRIDNRDLNQNFLKYNDRSYLVNWDESRDIPYMKKHNMI